MSDPHDAHITTPAYIDLGCTCGGWMRGWTAARDVHRSRRAFAATHSGPGHQPCNPEVAHRIADQGHRDRERRIRDGGGEGRGEGDDLWAVRVAGRQG